MGKDKSDLLIVTYDLKTQLRLRLWLNISLKRSLRNLAL